MSPPLATPLGANDKLSQPSGLLLYVPLSGVSLIGNSGGPVALLCALRLKFSPQIVKATPFRRACKLEHTWGAPKFLQVQNCPPPRKKLGGAVGVVSGSVGEVNKS